MAVPSSPPCRKCGQEPLTPHLTSCPERAERRRYMVGLTSADRRWRFRDKVCGVRSYRYGVSSRCRGKATLWMVGPRGGILGVWCDRHEPVGVRAFMQGHPDKRGTLRDADYLERSSDEELAVWAIGRGPVVRPWLGVRG